MMKHKFCWPKFKAIILKVWQVLFHSQTYLEKSGCYICACELRYHTYSYPLVSLWKCNVMIGNLRMGILSTPEDVGFRVGKLGEESIKIHSCELHYCELRYQCLFFYSNIRQSRLHITSNISSTIFACTKSDGTNGCAEVNIQRHPITTKFAF